MAFYLQEARDMGLEILPPDINRSSIEFTPSGTEKILFGLQGIKNVGLAALENIIAERTAKGPFTSLFEFCKRIDLRTSNKRVLEHLICAGAFDAIPGTRAQKVNELEKIMDLAAEHKKVAATGQMGLFLMSDSSQNTMDERNNSDEFVYQMIPDWSDKEKLEKEKEVIGFYLSAHPLESYKKILQCLAIESFDVLLKKGQFDTDVQEITVIGAGLVKSKREIITKKGDRMAFMMLEDTHSSAEIILFPSTFKKVESYLNRYHIFIVKGGLDATSPHKCKIKANECIPIDLFFQEWPNIQKLICKLPPSISESFLSELKNNFTAGSVPLEFIFSENSKMLRLATREKIAVNIELIEKLNSAKIATRCLL